MNALIAAMLLSLNTLEPTVATTNSKPTKVAAAVPASMKKSCHAWATSATPGSIELPLPLFRRTRIFPASIFRENALSSQAITTEGIMHKLHVSVVGMSVLFACGLALWEIYFFWAVDPNSTGGFLGIFSPTRLGFNLAWLLTIYLTFQLISIPFAVPASRGRFLGVVDGLASILPLSIVLIVMFGKPQLLQTEARWEAAFLLLFVTAVDLFGGYAFNIALSRRTFDVAGGPSS